MEGAVVGKLKMRSGGEKDGQDDSYPHRDQDTKRYPYRPAEVSIYLLPQLVHPDVHVLA